MTGGSVRSPEQILLFDAVPFADSVLTDELNSAGFRVDTASDLKQVTRLAGTRPHDLVLIAESVPRDAAADLCEQLRKEGPDAPPILLLAPLGAIETQTDRTALRADDFLITPYTETEVIIRVQAMLKTRAERNALRARVQELSSLTVLDEERLGEDDLTELPNRKYLEDFAARELIRAERYDRVISLAKVELDHLYTIKATHGPEAGDAVLRQVAGLFRTSVRCVDFTARYDRDEFAIVFPETDKLGAVQAAERVRQRIERLELSNFDGRPIPRVTASLGVATFPQDAPDLQSLIGAADLHLGLARDQGRNRVATSSIPGAPGSPDGSGC